MPPRGLEGIFLITLSGKRGSDPRPSKAFYIKELPVKNRVTKTCLDTNNAYFKQKYNLSTNHKPFSGHNRSKTVGVVGSSRYWTRWGGSRVIVRFSCRSDREHPWTHQVLLASTLPSLYVIVTFLSILNMTKDREINITQDKNFGNIYIEGCN